MAHGRRICFVDDAGGALSALGAGIALALGYADAIATTTTTPAPLPPEVRAVLEEIGGRPADVTPLASAPLEGVEHVRLGRAAKDGWDVWLHEGDGDLERLSAARIARDRIERNLDPRPIARRGSAV